MTKPCPVPGCGWTITEGSVMCAHHWQMLPDSLQRDARNAQLRPLNVNARDKLHTRIRCALESVAEL